MNVRSQWDIKKDVTKEIDTGELITDRSQAQKTSDIIQRVITGRNADVHVYNDEVDCYRNVEKFDLYDRMDLIDSEAERRKQEYLNNLQNNEESQPQEKPEDPQSE